MNFTSEQRCPVNRAEVVPHCSAPRVNPGAQVSASLVAARVAQCRDVVLGLRTILELAERSVIDASCEPPRPHLGVFQLGALERMAIQTASLLDARLEAFADELQDLPPGEVH